MSWDELKKYPDEIIKPIHGHEDGYLISNYGRFFSLSYRQTGKIKELRPYERKRKKDNPENGHYLAVDIMSKRFSAHRLVASHFIPNPENKPQVNHISGKKGDNRSINLEWATGSDNQRHAFDNNLHSSRKGVKNNSSKINDDNAIEIMNLLKTTDLNQSQIAEKVGCSRKTVSNINTGKNWGHLFE